MPRGHEGKRELRKMALIHGGGLALLAAGSILKSVVLLVMGGVFGKLERDNLSATATNCLRLFHVNH